MDKNINEQTSKNGGEQGGLIGPDGQPIKKAPEKKGFWGSLSPDTQATVVIIGSVALGIVALMVGGAVATTIEQSSRRATLNSDGFKKLIENGNLDPIPPPKTLEEAAARMVERSHHMLPISVDEVIVHTG